MSEFKSETGDVELLAIVNHIETGLSKERDVDDIFSPPISRREWRIIANALRLAATRQQSIPVAWVKTFWRDGKLLAEVCKPEDYGANPVYAPV